VSWLFVALIPGLLMLATFGLDRVESGLCCDAISANDVAEFLNPAGAGDRNTVSPDEMSYLLPTRQYFHHGANPVFQQTRHMNSV
jgi:hypothetical protein